MKHLEMKAKTPVLSQTDQTSCSATKCVNDFTCNRRQRTLHFHGNWKNFKLTSSPSWQPCLASQENVMKKFMLKNSALCKYTRHNQRTSLQCPRFTAHMKISPGILESTQMLNTKFQGPFKQINQNRKLFPTQRNTCKDSVCVRRGQEHTVQINIPIHHEYKIPKLPPASVASSKEDVAEAIIHPHIPSLRIQETPLTRTIGMEEKQREPRQPELMGASTDTEEDPELDELDRFQNSVSPLLSETEHIPINFSRLTSSIRSSETLCSFERDTDWSDFSRKLSSATVSRENSTPPSQSCRFSPSVSVMASSDTELEAVSGCSQTYQPILHTGSLLVASDYCSGMLSPSLNSSSCHGTADILQASSYSVKKCSGRTPSFVEIWHDRLLHHWPVLPPISPQRAHLDTTCNVRSEATKLSNDSQDVLSELQGSNQKTGHSSSQRNGEDTSNKDISDVSAELSKMAASLSIGCVTEEESLAEIRLSLLDHQSWEKTDQDEGIQNDVEKWCKASEDILRYEMKNTIGSIALDTNDFLLHPAPAFLKGNKTSDTCSNNGITDQQSVYTMTVGMNLPNTLKNTDNSLCTTELHPNKDLRIKPSIAGASLVKDCCLLSQLTVLKEPMEDACKDIDVFCTEDERPGDSRRHICADGGKHSKMDTNFQQGREPQEKMDGSQAPVLHIYSKLQEMQTPMFKSPESRTISNFEDFDFLAKYCIFSQEKLAKYKRAFEAMDFDGDGYLNCLQVLMALKEIVPSDALTDAEELYVYRILEIVDYYVTDGLTDLRLFAVMASLAQKIAALDNFMKSLIGGMDFKALELKMYNARQLFLWNIDSQSRSITVDQLLIELKAGGLSEEHEKAVQRELQHIQKLDLLDFLTYLPLFDLIHNSVIANPLDDSRTI